MNRFIIVSALSHAFFVFIIGLTSFNAVRELPVYQVNIVRPFENEKTPPARSVPQRTVTPPPQVHENIKKPLDKRIKPDSLFDKGGLIRQRDEGRSKSEPAPAPSARKEAPEESSGAPSLKNEPDGTMPSAERQPALAPPSALFDRTIIEKFAKKDLPADKGLTFDTSEFKHRGYMRMLKEKIESTWKYPKEAARLGISGDLYVKFTIMKDGRLGDVELLRTSGHKDLDDAAIKALKDAEPYWPLPSDWEKEGLEIKGYFIYIYGNTYVM